MCWDNFWLIYLITNIKYKSVTDSRYGINVTSVAPALETLYCACFPPSSIILYAALSSWFREPRDAGHEQSNPLLKPLASFSMSLYVINLAEPAQSVVSVREADTLLF